MNDLYAEYDITMEKLKSLNFSSTHGIGNTSVKDKYLVNKKVKIPAGEMFKTKCNSSLLYDEFIVYDINQIKQKYIILMKIKLNI